jgi:hypothetical protein
MSKQKPHPLDKRRNRRIVRNQNEWSFIWRSRAKSAASTLQNDNRALANGLDVPQSDSGIAEAFWGRPHCEDHLIRQIRHDESNLLIIRATS